MRNSLNEKRKKFAKKCWVYESKIAVKYGILSIDMHSII